MGFRTVALSSSDRKRDLALKLGADIYIDESKQNAAEELQKLGGANAILTTSPSSKSIMPLLEGLAFEGKLMVVAVPHDEVQFNPGTSAAASFSTVSVLNASAGALLGRRLSIHGSFVGTNEDCARTVAFTVKHNIKIWVEKFPMSKVYEAFERRENAQFRAVVLPWE